MGLGNMKVIKLIFLFLTLTIATSVQALDSDSLVLLKDLDKKLMNYKSNRLAIDKSLRASAKHYGKSLDRDFIKEVLKRYKKLLSHNPQYYIVEMFYPIYIKDKKKFEVYLDESLSQKEKLVFLKFLKMVEREEMGGNG